MHPAERSNTRHCSSCLEQKFDFLAIASFADSIQKHKIGWLFQAYNMCWVVHVGSE